MVDGLFAILNFDISTVDCVYLHLSNFVKLLLVHVYVLLEVYLLLPKSLLSCSSRLGIKRLYLVDYDVVDVSNLNRQVLFATQDIDRRKVNAAMDGLARHNIQTELVPVHLDAVLEWGKVVEMAKKSSVIVNAIDYGEYFDYAVTSLSVSLECDYVSGSSYGHTVISENYPAVRDDNKSMKRDVI